MESCRSRLEIKPGMQCSDLASIAHTTNSLRMVCARKACRPRVAYTSRSTRGARSASDGNRIQSNLTGYSVSDRAVRGSSATGAGALRERWRERGRRGISGVELGKGERVNWRMPLKDTRVKWLGVGCSHSMAGSLSNGCEEASGERRFSGKRRCRDADGL